MRNLFLLHRGHLVVMHFWSNLAVLDWLYSRVIVILVHLAIDSFLDCQSSTTISTRLKHWHTIFMSGGHHLLLLDCRSGTLMHGLLGLVVLLKECTGNPYRVMLSMFGNEA